MILHAGLFTKDETSMWYYMQGYSQKMRLQCDITGLFTKDETSMWYYMQGYSQKMRLQCRPKTL